MNTAEALLGLGGMIGLIVTRVVRSELPWIARNALRTGSKNRLLIACRVSTWDVYAALVLIAVALLIVSDEWEYDTALTAVVIGSVVGIAGGLAVERLSSSATSYWELVETSLEDAVSDPACESAKRTRFNGQRNRLTFGSSKQREEEVDAILRA
jgi:hypothetical protein